MGLASTLKLAVLHPNELRALIQFWLFNTETAAEKLSRDPTGTGWDRESMKRCWYWLDMTSRSFAAVIRELGGELSRVVCLFYLVLRALDTIEDDMTLPLKQKEDLLRAFAAKLDQPGWTFEGSGPDEKDRGLLVEFDRVIEEFRQLKKPYQVVIQDLAQKMGEGMAHYSAEAVKGTHGLETCRDLDMYCHFVAGLVGEGLSRIFAASGQESTSLDEQMVLANHMGLFLQKTNILRDFKEDLDDGRHFWPKEIWGKYAKEIEDLGKPENIEAALQALSHMTLDALQHATRSLDYLSLLRNQSVFNFCAIPQVMAIATLEECFANPRVFQTNVKIRKGLALSLIEVATNPRDVAYLFVRYGRRIHAKANKRVHDPNYIRISIVLGQLEQWTETHFPNFAELSSNSPVALPYPRSMLAAGVTRPAANAPLSKEAEDESLSLTDQIRLAEEAETKKIVLITSIAVASFFILTGLFGAWILPRWIKGESFMPATIRQWIRVGHVSDLTGAGGTTARTKLEL